MCCVKRAVESVDLSAALSRKPIFSSLCSGFGTLNQHVFIYLFLPYYGFFVIPKRTMAYHLNVNRAYLSL